VLSETAFFMVEVNAFPSKADSRTDFFS